jgi:hypothetical protein
MTLTDIFTFSSFLLNYLVSSILCGQYISWENKRRYSGKDEATFEDLAFGVRSLREVDRVDLRVCLSAASYAAAEKAERRMALKI